MEGLKKDKTETTQQLSSAHAKTRERGREKARVGRERGREGERITARFGNLFLLELAKA